MTRSHPTLSGNPGTSPGPSSPWQTPLPPVADPYGAAWGSAADMPGGPLPTAAPALPPPATTRPPKQPGTPNRWRRPAFTAAALIVALGIGGIGGALLTNNSAPAPAQPVQTVSDPVPTDTHAEDVKLCTQFYVINSAMPAQPGRADDDLPGVAALQSAINAHPGASPEVRDSLSDYVSWLYSHIASYVPLQPRGLAEPPEYSAAQLTASYDRAWAACGLDEE